MDREFDRGEELVELEEAVLPPVGRSCSDGGAVVFVAILILF